MFIFGSSSDLSAEDLTFTMDENGLQKTKTKLLSFPSSSTISSASGGSTQNHCLCDTNECISNDRSTCITLGMCYSEYMDKGNGFSKWIHGW